MVVPVPGTDLILNSPQEGGPLLHSQQAKFAPGRAGEDTVSIETPPVIGDGEYKVACLNPNLDGGPRSP